MEMFNLLDVMNFIYIPTKNIGTNSRQEMKSNAPIAVPLFVLMFYSLMNLMALFMDKK
jgi:hypothetical protein